MLDLYQDSRLAPNESIAREVNFRLLEAASCGCLVFSQDVGEDQDVLLVPGREMETFGHVLELKARMDHALARPEQAEAKARAAWERVQREHLPGHRARAVVDFAADLPRTAAAGAEAREAFGLTLLMLQRSQRLELDWDGLLALLAGAAEQRPSPEVLAGLARSWAELGRAGSLAGLLASLRDSAAHIGHPDLDLACSMAALHADMWPEARRFWYRRRALLAPDAPAAAPRDPAHLCLLWAEEMQRAGRAAECGMGFEPGRHVPATAEECLELARHLGAEPVDAARRLDTLYARLPGREYMRLGHLSLLTLHRREQWRLGLQLAVVNLRCCRLRQGLEELHAAFATAASQGKEQAFSRALEGLDKTGYIRAALDAMNAAPKDA
jgi:hypothetical protein